MLEGFGKKNATSEAANAEFSRQFASLDLEQLDDAIDDAPVSEPEPEPEPEPELEPGLELEPESVSLPPYPGSEELQLDTDRPNLEPVGDDAHPPENRRMPTQPPSALALALEDLRPPSTTSTGEAPLPPPPKLAPRQSPAPVRRGLFTMDRPTNFLAGAAVGLLLTIIPAKKFARNYEVSQIEPMITDLEGAVAHPLGVEAGLVENPNAIAARIHDGRKKVRRRYMTIWLGAGLLIGAGLGFAPRPGD